MLIERQCCIPPSVKAYRCSLVKHITNYTPRSR